MTYFRLLPKLPGKEDLLTRLTLHNQGKNDDSANGYDPKQNDKIFLFHLEVSGIYMYFVIQSTFGVKK
jgi:hypothetical protein